MSEIVISGTGLATPTDSVTNEELVAAFNQHVNDFNANNAAAIAAGEVEALRESSAEFIVKASGIKSRYMINASGVLDPKLMKPQIPLRNEDEPSLQAEYSVNAAKQAIANANLTPADIDAVIVSCSSIQRGYPAVAIEVQNLLGIEGFAYDMNVACSSTTFGIQNAYNMIKAGNARRVLMVNPELTTGHLNFTDRDSHFIFGDAATAVIIEDAEHCKAKETFEIIDTKVATNFSNNIRNNFGFLNRCELGELDPELRLFKQQGRKVFKDVTLMTVKLLKEQLAKNNLQPDDLSRLWLHQANINMNGLIAEKLMGRPVDRIEAPIILDEFANTASCGSVIAFHKHHDNLNVGDICLLCSFGAGYSVGSIILRKAS